MGYYTELVLGVELDDSTPSEVIDILKFMSGDGEKPDKLPCHPLFDTERWCITLLRGDSAYFPGPSYNSCRFNSLDSFEFSVRSSLKNYDQEIEKFLHWIESYISRYSYGFMGYMRGEDAHHPTLIYRTDDGIKFVRVTGDGITKEWYLNSDYSDIYSWLEEC